MTEQVSKENLIKEVERLMSPHGYLFAGVPKFQGLFGRDSLISAWQLLDHDPIIARNTLVELSKVQGQKVNEITGEEPGKIPHEYYGSDTDEAWFDLEKKGNSWLKKGQPIYFSIDATPLYLIVFEKYVEKTGDNDLAREKWENIKLAVSWIQKYLADNGLVAHEVLDAARGLESQSWKDGIGEPVRRIKGSLAVVEVQGYSYAALMAASRLADKLGKKRYGLELRHQARKFKHDFNEKFWNEKEKFYFFGIDGEGNQIKSVTSNPGHLLFTGIINKKNARHVVKRLFAYDMWTKYGIRTHSILDPDFNERAYQLGTVWPHDNWIIAQGLKSLGYEKEYQRIVEAMIAAYKEMDCVPELFGVTLEGRIFLDELEDRPCYPQAWSTAAMLDLLN